MSSGDPPNDNSVISVAEVLKELNSYSFARNGGVSPNQTANDIFVFEQKWQPSEQKDVEIGILVFRNPTLFMVVLQQKYI